MLCPQATACTCAHSFVQACAAVAVWGVCVGARKLNACIICMCAARHEGVDRPEVAGLAVPPRPQRRSPANWQQEEAETRRNEGRTGRAAARWSLD